MKTKINYVKIYFVTLFISTLLLFFRETYNYKKYHILALGKRGLTPMESENFNKIVDNLPFIYTGQEYLVYKILIPLSLIWFIVLLFMNKNKLLGENKREFIVVTTAFFICLIIFYIFVALVGLFPVFLRPLGIMLITGYMAYVNFIIYKRD